MEPRFFNRELSWIEFNNRVLYQGLRKELPLMERIQFLSIITSNFDEFFQVRVASVKRMMMENPDSVDISGLTPEVVLRQISARCHQILRTQHDCIKNDIIPELEGNGIFYVKPEKFTSQQSDYTQNLFRNEIFPLLTPLRTDTEVFPTVANLSLYAAFLLKPISGIRDSNIDLKGDDDLPRIALVQVPQGISPIVWLPSPDNRKKCSHALKKLSQNTELRCFRVLRLKKRSFLRFPVMQILQLKRILEAISYMKWKKF